MKLITLHDHLNQTQEVEINSDEISAITPFGSGSSLQVGAVIISVHESPAEVKRIIES